MSPAIHAYAREGQSPSEGPSLSGVHLQKSQALRARSAAKGVPPVWWLYALLGVDTPKPDEQVRTSHQVVVILDSGGTAQRPTSN